MVPQDVLTPEFPLIPGDYVVPAVCSQNQDPVNRQDGLCLADRQRPPFEGWINGIRLYSLLTARYGPSVERRACQIRDFPLVEELTFEYLPAGTHARGPQFAGECPSGSFSFAMREFDGFDVVYFLGERVLGHDASADRVTKGVIQGKEAVIIVPLHERGDRSWVAFATNNGFISIDSGLRLTETLKVAEGVKCASC